MDIPQYFVYPQEEGSCLQYFLMSCARTFSPLCGIRLPGPIWTFHPNQNSVLQNLWSFTTPLKSPMIRCMRCTPKSQQSPETGSAEGICNCKQSLTRAKDQLCRKGQMNECCEAMKLSTFIC